MNAVVRAVTALLCALVPLVSLAPAATAAAPAGVSIRTPRDGGTSDGRSLVVTGRARSVTEVLVTAGEAGGFATVERGTWTVTLEHLPADTVEVCATATGTRNTATDCVTHTVVPSPATLTFQSPEQGSVVEPRTYVAGSCTSGTTVDVSSDDGITATYACSAGWFDGFLVLAEGPRSLTAVETYAGQTIATVGVTFTVQAPEPTVIAISSPLEASSGPAGYITVTGTAANAWQDLLYVGPEDSLNWGAPVDEAGQWNARIFVPAGTGMICAVARDPLGAEQGRDCVTYTAVPDLTGFGFVSPEEGETTAPDHTFRWGCAPGTDSVLTLDDGQEVRQICQHGEDYWGPWSQPLTDGVHTATLRAEAGGQTLATDTVTFTADATPPGAPLVTSPLPSIVTEVPLTLSGTAEVGGRVVVPPLDLSAAESTEVLPDGTWSITLDDYFFRNSGAVTGSPTPLELSAVAVDRFANRSAPTAVSLVVNLAP
jgi:large repetitive protein